MQIATINDSTKALPDTSTERVTSLMTRVGARSVVQQNQQQFATFLADEQANSNTNADSSLDRTAKSNARSENTQSNAATERTRAQENDQARSDRSVRETQSFDEDPPPVDDAQDTYAAISHDAPTSVQESSRQDETPVREEVTDATSQVTVDDSDTSDTTIQAEVLTLAALRSSPIVPREIMTETPVVSNETDSIPLIKSEPVDVFSISISNSQTQNTENSVAKDVVPATTEVLSTEIPSPVATKQITTEIPLQAIEPINDDGNLVPAQITKPDAAVGVSSWKSDFSTLLAASSEAALSGNTKAVKENLVSTGSPSTENLVITGTQTASGKSLTEMAVTFMPDQGRGGERAGPEDMAVSPENRSTGTTTPVVGLQTINSTKGLFSVRPESLAGASSTTTVIDLTAETVRYMTANGEKTMTVKLSPASLGDMRIEVSTVNDILSVKLVSGNSTARELLNQHIDVLRDALSQTGLEIGRVTVTSGFSSPQNSHFSQQQSGAWPQGSSSTLTTGNFSLSAATEDTPVQRSRRVAYYNGALDVSV